MQFQAILPAQKYRDFYINSRAIACKKKNTGYGPCAISAGAGNAWISLPA